MIISLILSISLYSDVDPDPVGSAFIWVRGSGSRGIKLREKQTLTNNFLKVFFVGNIFFKSETKKVANL